MLESFSCVAEGDLETMAMDFGVGLDGGEGRAAMGGRGRAAYRVGEGREMEGWEGRVERGEEKGVPEKVETKAVGAIVQRKG